MKDRLVVITGPTASGKSDIAINLAKYLDSSVISADSQQVYRYMNIGTNKTEDIFEIDHFMIDLVNPNENFSVEDFSIQARDIVKKLNDDDRIPIVAGGTGFYIDSLLFEMNYGQVKKNQAYRDEMIELANTKGKDYLYDKLIRIDPISAERYHPNEVNRIIRALEIYYVSGEVPSKMRTGERKLNKEIEPLVFFLNYKNRDTLYHTINNRVIAMIENGLIDEVKSLVDSYKLDENSQSMAAIGYKEVLMYFDGKIGKEDLIKLIQRNTRRYAKRQITWMKKYLNFRFGHEILLDNISKGDASNIILDVIKGVYEI